MEENYWNLLNIETVILSRGRSDTIISHKLFPDAVLCIPDSEKEAYAHIPNRKVYVPDNIKGLGFLRNWILDNFPNDAIVMVDDDVKKLWINSRLKGEGITDPEIIKQVIYSTALCAKDLGTSCFGFNQKWDTRKYRPTEPFAHVGFAGGVIGIIGRRIRFIDHLFKVDVDFCLETLKQDRVIWLDNRYSFVQTRNNNKGGNSLFRTREKVEQEVDNLRKKWGQYYTYEETKSGEKTTIKIARKRSVDI